MKQFYKRYKMPYLMLCSNFILLSLILYMLNNLFLMSIFVVISYIVLAYIAFKYNMQCGIRAIVLAIFYLWVKTFITVIFTGYTIRALVAAGFSQLLYFFTTLIG